jgi:signal recognition particle subunit SRP54
MFNFLSQKFSGVLDWLHGKSRITQDDINQAVAQLRDALIDADVPQQLVTEFLESVTSNIKGFEVQKSLKPGEQIIKCVHDQLVAFLGGAEQVSGFNPTLPSVVMVMGLQGSGKTTTLAKLAHFILTEAKTKGKKRNILLASVDFYRPAAIDQLEILAGQVGVDFYRATATTSVEAAQEIYQNYKNKSYDLLFLDTAGRLHVDAEMMQELQRIDALLEPKKKLMVLDAMTGQESLNVARAFDQMVGFDAAILSKMDSETRGGAAFSFRYALKKPIIFLGVGERIADLEQFVPDRIASRMLGMGDVLSLIEKATKNLDKKEEKEQEEASRRFLSGTFTLDDFLQQLGFMDKIGSFQKLISYMPGMQKVTPEMIQKGQQELKSIKAIVQSMTKKERQVPTILDASRKRRIARGSGTEVADINQMLQKFEQTKQFAKMLKNTGGLRGLIKR